MANKKQASKPKTKVKSKNKSKITVSFFRNLTFKKKLAVAVFTVLAFSAVGTYILSFSSAAVPKGTYSNWFWPSPAGGLTSLQHELTVEALGSTSAPYFWSHQFKMVGGDGGYIGLQNRGNRVNGTQGKTAVFSIFGAGIAGSPSVNCSVEQAGFDGYNSSGTSCRIPFEWAIGRKYQLTVSAAGTSSKGKLWAGTVKDLTTNATTQIATITVPNTWQGLGSWSVMWTEFFGPQPTTCAALPLSKVRFYTPRSSSGAPQAGPNNTLSSNIANLCTNSSITNYAGSVVQQVGSAITSSSATAPSAPTTTTPISTSPTTTTSETKNPQPDSTTKPQK